VNRQIDRVEGEDPLGNRNLTKGTQQQERKKTPDGQRSLASLLDDRRISLGEGKRQ